MVELQCCVSCGVEQSESVINIHVATLLKKNKRRYFIMTRGKIHEQNITVLKAMAPHSSVLAWKIPWMEEPGGLPSMGSHRVGHD